MKPASLWQYARTVLEDSTKFDNERITNHGYRILLPLGSLSEHCHLNSVY